MRIHRVYCKSVSGPNTKFALDNLQSHHLIKALRLKEGRVVEVFDGNGSSASVSYTHLTLPTTLSV